MTGMEIQAVAGETAGLPYVSGLVAHGDLVFVSGQTPLLDGVLVDASIEAQVEAVLSKIEAILGRAGSALSQVVHCGVYVADLGDLPGLNSAYEQAFAGRLPTRTTVGVNLPGYGVEIDCVAVLPDH